MATAAMMIKTADNTRSHSLLIAIAASAVAKQQWPRRRCPVYRQLSATASLQRTWIL